MWDFYFWYDDGFCKQDQAKEGLLMRITYFTNFLIKQAGWAVFIFLILCYRMPASHTIPFMFDEYVKETSRLCRQVFPPVKPFLYYLAEPWDLRRHQIPHPSIQRSHSGLTVLICKRFSCRSVIRPLCQKKLWLHSWYISLLLSQWPPPAKGPCERLAPVRV